MPATKDHVLAVARATLGYRETGSNRTRFGKWYGMDGVPWCAIWVSWVADRAQAEDIIPRHAYTPAGAAWFMRQGRWSQKANRGDIVYYAFPGMGRISHVGIVEAVHRDGSITAIEANTNAVGSRTGGRVMRKRRSRSLIAGFGHPDYSTQAQMARLKREAEAAAKASRLAKARAAATAKLKAATARAAAALKAKNAKAKAAAAAVALALAAGGGAVATGGTSEVPTPTVSPNSAASPSVTPPPAPSPSPTAGPTPQATVTKPAAKPRAVAANPFTLRRILKYTRGKALMRGPDVRKVQSLVGAKDDGEFGRRTAAKVRAWQRERHIRADGEFGRSSAQKAGWLWSPR